MKPRTKEHGFTLIEMLVTMAVLGIVMSSLASVYAIMADGMLRTTSRASALEALNLAANQIVTDLQGISLNYRNADTQPFRLVGINPDSKFENSKKTPHNTLGTNPNEHSDRLHIIANFRDSQFSPSRMASERVYYAYWINGESSPKVKPEFCLAGYNNLTNDCSIRGRYGLLKRRSTHSRADAADGSLIPQIEDYSTGDSVTAPLLDLNKNNTNHRGLEILGINIDYLSFRFYDTRNSTWQNCWDPTNQDPSCNHSGDDGGKFPAVVQFAIRAYDRRANQDDVHPNELMDPVWHQTAVTLRDNN